ncbi:uncharacterized protein LOC126837376 isoform X1 [Adelges cooleyi]|uniref:uncharacterized protein LOC126837376 isoform X1 n=1 Tax=Adelges cooleyi TaxID=133065 RepID=UPI00217F775F|nr:uncharacterized protein LOC126837376 isoform X1 [Adelges cooleyi]
MVTFSYFLVVLSVCICTFANDLFEEDDLVFFAGQNNSTGYWMFVTEDGQCPEPNNPNMCIILKKGNDDYNAVKSELASSEDDFRRKRFRSATIDHYITPHHIKKGVRDFINQTYRD